MSAESCLQVRRRLAGVAMAALVSVAGCTPRAVYWLDSTQAVQPEAPKPEPVHSPEGFLSIKTQHFGESYYDGMESFPPVYLYDRNGNLLSTLPNNTDNPMGLQPGDYIVIIGESTDPMGEFRQLQVHVADGQTTRVSQADIDHAPEFWALSRWISH